MIKEDKQITNPVTNGKTKKMISSSLLFLFLIVVIAMCIIIIIDETIESKMIRITVSSTLSGVISAGTGGDNIFY